MSYGDAFLDLSSCTVACLTGFNGAGKSAILDAVTWALWECARSNSDDLMRTGEQDMWVELTFELEDNIYRVRRTRQKAFAPGGSRTSTKGSLDFQILDSGKNNGDEKHWRSLNGPSVKETRARICSLLRMDYDTFINSVYLRQGRADEFTTKPPAERKQVLSEILGLDYFDRLQELAKEHGRETRARIEALKATLGHASTIDEQLEQTTNESVQLEADLEQAKKQRQQCQARLKDLAERAAHLSNLKAQIEPTRARLVEIEGDIELLNERMQANLVKLAQITALAEEVGDAEKLRTRFNELRTQVEQLDRISMDRQELESKRFELRSTVATMRGRLEVELEHCLAQADALRQKIQKLKSQLTAKPKLTSDYETYKQLLAKEAELARAQETFALLSERAEKLNTAIVESRFYLEAHLEQKRQALKELEVLILSRATLTAESADLTARRQQLDKTESEFELVEQQGLQAKQEIDACAFAIGQLQQQLAEQATKVKEIHDCQSSICPLCAAPMVDRAAVLAKYAQQSAEITDKIQHAEIEQGQLEEKRQHLRLRYVELKRLLDERQKLDVAIGDFNARTAALTRADEAHARLVAEIKEIEEKLSQQGYAQIERESLIAIKAELHKLDFDPVVYSSLQSQIRSQRHIEIRYQQADRDEGELKRSEEELMECLKKVENTRASLETDNFAPDLSEQIKILDAHLERQPYDRLHHQALKQELSALLPLSEKLKQLECNIAEQPSLDKEHQALEERLASRRKQQEDLSRSIAVWSNQSAALPDLATEQESEKTTITMVEESIESITRNLTIAQTKLESLKQQSADVEQKQAQLSGMIAEMNDYQFLAEAFGKKGIQAVIIENAVPEIEAEANLVLSRLTDNQLHVALVTQQKTKQGVVTETLEIVIADQLGTRAYELYSGGEAFKINFAIRLALSRLLARRAGAKLQSLIIDEGFGSQDEISRARLVKAINAIRNDFARILIVTHIAEIKDLFPTQIQVKKHNGISTLNLVHA